MECASARTPGAGHVRVVLVRHGETAWNARGVYQGWQDVPLSVRGREQAAGLAGRLTRVALDAAYCSPLRRARDTAELLLAGREGVALVEARELRELSYGALEGVEPVERTRRWPALDARWRDDPWNVHFPGGESLAGLEARVLPLWHRLLAAHAGGTILVSTHGHVNRVILLHMRRLERARFWSVAQPNGSATFLECVPEVCAGDGGRGTEIGSHDGERTTSGPNNER